MTGLVRPAPAPAVPVKPLPKAEPKGREAVNGVADLMDEVSSLAALAAPRIAWRLGLMGMAIVDGAMLARHGTAQLAAQGLAEVFVGRLLDVALLWVMAGMALAALARAGGARTRGRIGSIWHLGLMKAVLFGLLAMGLGQVAAPLLSLLGQPRWLADASGQVLGVLSLGVMPLLMALATGTVLEALGHRSLVLLVLLAANVVNVLLNILLIPGLDGAQPLGALGAAWATTASRWLMALVLLACAWWLPKRDRYALRGVNLRAAWALGRGQRQRGRLAAGSVLTLALLATVPPVMAGSMSLAALTECVAMLLALAPVVVLAWGLADAAGLRLSALKSAPYSFRQPYALRDATRRLVLLTLVSLGLLLGVYLIEPQLALRWATQDAALLPRVAALMPWGVGIVLAEALTLVCISALRSLGELRASIEVQVVTGVALVPLAWLWAFGARWGLSGVLAAVALTAAARALAMVWLLDRCANQHDRSRTLAWRNRMWTEQVASPTPQTKPGAFR